MNVSQLIRDILSEQPDATPTEIVSQLKDRGINTTRHYAAVVKSKMRKHRDSAISQEVIPLLKAKNFANDVGGIEAAIKLLKGLQQLLHDDPQ